MTHELGHGVVEKALAADSTVLAKYAAAVGWVGDRLYDLDRSDAQEALKNGRKLPEAARITAKNWERAEILEQPMSEYMVTSPFEDLPETIAAYLNRPDVLKARSPRRFAFVEQHIGEWRRVDARHP